MGAFTCCCLISPHSYCEAYLNNKENAPYKWHFHCFNLGSFLLGWKQWLKYEQFYLWSASLGTDPKQRYCLLREWCRFECRQRSILLYCFSCKLGCHYSCYPNTFSAKTVQHSFVQSSHYGLFDRVGSSAAVYCMAFDDSPHPRILQTSDWTAQRISVLTNGFHGMVVCQLDHHQLWPPLRGFQAFGLPCKHNEER